MIRTRLARRTATAALALTAVLGGLTAQASTASAATYGPSINCSTRTVDAPLIARPAQLTAFYFLSWGQWQTSYILTVGTENWKLYNGSWSYAGQAGGFYLIPDMTTQAWTYTWTHNGTQFVQQGWTYHGAC